MSTTQTYELFVQTTPEALWRALVDGNETQKYFFGTTVKSSLREGEPITYTMPDGSPASDGKILACKPREKLSLTWRVQYDPALSGEVSKVDWELEKMGPAVKLTVRHDLTDAPLTAEHVKHNGWGIVLSGLKTLLETGKPLDLGEMQ